MAWYSGVEYEQYAFLNRTSGPYWWAYATMMTCNVISPQLFWFKKIRTSIAASFILSIVVNIGMWFERFVIIVTSLFFPVINIAEIKSILKSDSQKPPVADQVVQNVNQ
jgi:hypothetical protein